MQSTKQLDPPPTASKPLDKDGKWTSTWVQWFNTLKPVLEATISQNRVNIPRVTTEQRDKIPHVTDGDMIHNTTLNNPQIYQGGTWKTFTIT